MNATYVTLLLDQMMRSKNYDTGYWIRGVLHTPQATHPVLLALDVDFTRGQNGTANGTYFADTEPPADEVALVDRHSEPEVHSDALRRFTEDLLAMGYSVTNRT